jgi:hypothetical protein
MNNPNYTELRNELDEARKKLVQARAKYDKKKKQLVKGIQEATPDLFGETKAQQANMLFDAPVDPKAVPHALQPFALDIDNAEAEVKRIEKLLIRVETIVIPDLFQQTA